MNYEDRLNELKKDLDKAKNIKYQAEARMEQLEKQEKEIIEELEKLNIKPENLDIEISKLSNEIEELFKEATSNLPSDLIKGE